MQDTLAIKHVLPKGLGEHSHQTLIELVQSPTLFVLKSKKAKRKAFFLSLLLHGNEPAGLEVLQHFARDGFDRFERDVYVLIGNVRAAQQNLRRLDEQPDFNRLFGSKSEHPIARALFKEIEGVEFACSIDIHNNSAHNPFYAIVTQVRDDLLHFAGAFSERAMFAELPDETLTHAMTERTPALTLECGAPHDEQARDRAIAFLSKCLKADVLPNASMPTVYETYATIRVEGDVDVVFGKRAAPAQLTLSHDLVSHNFHPVEKNTAWAFGDERSLKAIRVYEDDRDVSEQYFAIEGDALVTRVPFIPAMLTDNLDVIQKDCLGYVTQTLR